MNVGGAVKVKFTLFKNRFAFACGNHGFMLEKVGGGICLYATDHTHEELYCAMPLGMEREFKDSTYYIYAPNDSQMMLRVRKAVLLVDFAGHWCATNVPDFRVYGSKQWGQNCLIPWKEEYTQLYNTAEKAQIAAEKS